MQKEFMDFKAISPVALGFLRVHSYIIESVDRYFHVGTLRSGMQPVSPPLAYGIVDIAALCSLDDQYRRLIAQGGLSGHALFEAAIAKLRFSSREIMPEARYIVIAAVYAPPVRVTLDNGLERQRTFLPSEYFMPGFDMETIVADIKRSLFNGAGANVLHAGELPLKALAVGSGMAEYGRNNLAYVRGMGSFHRLYAFFTDHRGLSASANWAFPKVMEACRGCQLCAKACPTNAIALDHYMLHAGRCLTLFNEHDGEFPDWIPPEAHNALMGCMRCQWACPVNRPYMANLDQMTVLDEEDLELIKGAAPLEDLPETLQKKLHRNSNAIGSNTNKVWYRNLRALQRLAVKVEP